MVEYSKEYQEYLRSPEWKARAKKRMQMDGYRCQMCGCMGTTNNPLVVHHMGYDNLQKYGKENICKDLITLCQCCHERQHNMLQRVQSENGDRVWKNIHPQIAYVQTQLGEEPEIIKLPKQENQQWQQNKTS